MPFLKIKSKISKESLREKRVLGVCKKPNTTSKKSCSEPKISELMEHLESATHNCHNNEHQNLDLPVEDSSQSQAYEAPDDISGSGEKMEVASNYESNTDTIFSPSPVLDNELYPETDRGNNVHWGLPGWGADESSDKIAFDNQSFSASNFFFSDVLIASLPLYQSGNNDVFTDINPLPPYIFPEPNMLLDVEQYMLLPCLEDGSAISDEVKSDEDKNVGKHDLFMAFSQSRSQNLEAAEEFEQPEDFDPQLFIRDQPELFDVVSSYFPVMQPRDSLKRKATTLVLDLDETLVHSTLEECRDADFSFKIYFNMKVNTVYVKQRPHLYRFLERVAELFQVVVFTASLNTYASPLLDILDPDGKFVSQRFYRDSCILSDGIFIKDLTVLGYDLAKLAIVDNCPQVYRLQINNGIPIKSWYDDPTDDGLISLLPFLETLAEVNDVRPIIAKKFGNNE